VNFGGFVTMSFRRRKLESFSQMRRVWKQKEIFGAGFDEWEEPIEKLVKSA